MHYDIKSHHFNEKITQNSRPVSKRKYTPHKSIILKIKAMITHKHISSKNDVNLINTPMKHILPPLWPTNKTTRVKTKIHTPLYTPYTHPLKIQIVKSRTFFSLNASTGWQTRLLPDGLWIQNNWSAAEFINGNTEILPTLSFSYFISSLL